jgi:hypothetical protein
LVLLTGILFGVKLSGAMTGSDGMLVIIFSIVFLITTMMFIVFIQIIHLRDEVRLHKHYQAASPTTGSSRGKQGGKYA